MYDIKWAETFTEMNKNEDLNLQEFAMFYSKHIAKRRYKFHTINPKFPLFTVETYENHLPHLLGLQKWRNLNTNNPSRQFQLMFEGKLNLDYLKSADNHAWKESFDRIRFIPYLYNMLYKGECSIKLVHPHIPSPFQMRNMHLLFQKEGSKFIHVVELRKIQSGVHVPASITTHKVGSPVLNGKHALLKIGKIEVSRIKRLETINF